MSNTTIQHVTTVMPVNVETTRAGSRRQRSRSIIREFSLNTSTHGVPGIARSRTIPNRVFWSVSLLIFIGIMLYFIITSIINYFQYPTQTSVDIVVEWPQVFPAVTICNYSPFLYSRFIGPFLNYTNALNLTNTTDTTTFTRKQASYVRDFTQYTLSQHGNLNEFSYPLETMLMSCSYNDMPCSASNFTWFTSLRYGLCYVFNARTKHTDNGGLKYNSDNAGSGELLLSLYIHRHEYIPYVSKGAGMMVMIHNNDQLPIIVSGGLQLAPGKNHKLTYTKKTNIFLPSPYTSCRDYTGPAMQRMFDRAQDTDYTYSQTVCYMICTQTYIYEKCRCVAPANWASRFIVLPGTTEVIEAPLCNWTNTCYFRASLEFSEAGSLRDTYCADCGPECAYNTFTIKSSSLTTPMDYQLDDIRHFVNSTSVPLSPSWEQNWTAEISANYLSLEVICETTRTETFTQQAAIGPVDVLSNIGGQTGLWIGISFLSLFELVEMLFRLVRSRYHRFRNPVRQNAQEEVEVNTNI